jgi:hypothetical protein
MAVPQLAILDATFEIFGSESHQYQFKPWQGYFILFLQQFLRIFLRKIRIETSSKLRTIVFALTLNPSPIYGRGTLKFWLPFSHIWEKGLGDEGKSFGKGLNYRFQYRRGFATNLTLKNAHFVRISP